MQVETVPDALRDRLGREGTHGLVACLEQARNDWTADVIGLSAERFERRLAEELASLRVELAQGLAGVRQEIATSRVELLKWSFVFWVGQVVVMAGLLGLMLHKT